MPRRRPSFGTFRRSGSAPNRAWAKFEVDAIPVATGTKILLGGFSLSNQQIDETMLRTRGAAIVKPTTPSADAIVHGAWGMMVVSDLAAAAGAASIPGPVTDADHDSWFVWEPLLAAMEFSSAVGIHYDAGHVFPFDSKAKRIVQEGQQIVIMVESKGTIGTFDISLMFRMLSMVRGTR